MKANEEVQTLCGHLNVKRVFPDGREECVFDDHNIIVSGLGLSLGEAMAGDPNKALDLFQVDRFQLGVGASGTNTETSTLTTLYDPLKDEYGPQGNYVKGSNLVGDKKVTDQYFGKVNKSKTRRNGETSVTYSLVVDETMANGITRDGNTAPINEIGLFAKDPLEKEASVMIAYRDFTDIIKTPDFSVVFTWTISFLDNATSDQFSTHVFDLDYQISSLSTMLRMNWNGIGETDQVSGTTILNGDKAYEASGAAGAMGYGAWKLNTYANSVYPSIAAYDCGVIPPATPYLDPTVDPSAFQYTVVSGELNSAGNLPKIVELYPSSCQNYYRYMNTDETYVTRDVWSFLRPHNGIFSSSLKNKESQDQFELFTKILKSSGEQNWGFDAYCPVISTTYYSERVTNNPSKIQSIPNIRYHAFLNQVAYCEENGLTNCILPHFEFSVFWANSNSDLPTTDLKMAAIRDELVWAIERLKNSTAAFKINGRLVIRLFGSGLPDGPFRTPGAGETWDEVNAELRDFFDGIRKEVGNDFYAIRTGGNALSLGAWDGIQRLPSSKEFSGYVQPAGSYDFDDPEAVYEYYVNNADLLDLSAKLESGTYPGRIAGFLVIPGFSDIGLQFGAGNTREIPRQKETIEAGFSALNFFKSAVPQFKTAHALAWDDTIEGHCYFPCVSGQGPTEYGAYNIGTSGTWALDTYDEQFKSLFGLDYDPSATSPSATLLSYTNIKGCP